MKRLKRICSIMLAFAMVMMLVCPNELIKAAAKDNIPTKVRMQGENWDNDLIDIELADTTQSIKNVKTNNKNLVAKLTKIDISTNGNAAENRCDYAIGLYAKKNGTYKVTFDIVDKKGDKVSSKEVTVYAYDSALKKVTLDGKDRTYSLITKKSGKVKVTLQPGNKITKVEYGVYKTKTNDNGYSSEMVYKKFKNGGKVTFSTKGYEYKHEYQSEYSDSKYYSKNISSDIVAYTYIRVTYVDKYTKQNETELVSFYKLAK